MNLLNILVIVHALFWFALLIRYLRSGQCSVYHPLSIYHIFHALVFVIRPILVHFAGFDHVLSYMRYPLQEGDFIRALAISDIGLIVFQETMLALTRGYLPLRRPTVSLLRNARRSYLLMVLLVAPIGICALLKSSVASEGGIRDQATGVFINTTSNGYLYEAPGMLIVILIVGVVMTGFSRISVMSCAAYIGYILINVQHRWPMMVISFALFLSYHFYRGRRQAVRVGLIAGLFVVPLFYLKGVDRDYFKVLISGGTTGNVRKNEGPGATLADRWDGMDFANYEFLALYGAAWPKESGSYTYFTQWSQLFTEPIPRKVWHNKPVGPPIKMADFDLLDVANSVGITMSMVGAGWISLGYLGVVITSAISAWVFGQVFRWFCRRGDNFVVAACYFIIISLSPQYYRDGDISIFRFLLFQGIPLLVWMGVYRILPLQKESMWEHQ